MVQTLYGTVLQGFDKQKTNRLDYLYERLNGGKEKETKKTQD